MIKFLSIPCFLLVTSCLAQSEQAYMPLQVSVTANGDACGQFNVLVYKNNELVAELPPSKYGTFQLDLEVDQHFSVRVSKPGYREKTMAVDTHVPAGALTDDLVAYTLDLEPMDRFAHADPFYLDFPSGIIRWDDAAGRFDHSEHYLADIQLKVALLAAQGATE